MTTKQGDIPQAQDRAIRLPEVIKLTGKSRTSIYQGIKEGSFPKSFSIGRRARAWSLTAINQWIEAQKAGGEHE